MRQSRAGTLLYVSLNSQVGLMACVTLWVVARGWMMGARGVIIRVVFRIHPDNSVGSCASSVVHTSGPSSSDAGRHTWDSFDSSPSSAVRTSDPSSCHRRRRHSSASVGASAYQTRRGMASSVLPDRRVAAYPYGASYCDRPADRAEGEGFGCDGVGLPVAAAVGAVGTFVAAVVAVVVVSVGMAVVVVVVVASVGIVDSSLVPTSHHSSEYDSSTHWHA